MRINEDHDDWVVIGINPGDRQLAFQRATDWKPPSWPDPEISQQLHLDIRVDDVDAAERAVVALGARRWPAARETGFKVLPRSGGPSFLLGVRPAEVVVTAGSRAPASIRRASGHSRTRMLAVGNRRSESARYAFSERELRGALNHWGLSDARVTSMSPGVSGEVFLVEDDDGRRLVAKHAYMSREDFEPGLLAAEIVSSQGFRAACPVRTTSGEVLRMVTGPRDLVHPLALLTFVDGEPIDPSAPDAPRMLGRLLGSVHAALRDLAPEVLHIVPNDSAFLAYLRSDDQNLGEHQWLHSANREIADAAAERIGRGDMTIGPGVWDGPEVVADEAGSLGLLDFGNTGWFPAAHVMACGTMQVSPPGGHDLRDRAAEFIDAFRSAVEILDADVDAVPLFRRVSSAIYAKFMAGRSAAGRHPPELDDAFARVRAAVRSADNA